MKILVIEDDNEIIECVRLAFRVGWPSVKVVATTCGEKGIELVENESPDVVILDLGLPDINGFEVLKQIRQFSTVPVMIMTVRSDEIDIVRGLETGADEYVVKPFGQMELLARVKAILRRHRPLPGESSVICGPLNFTYSYRKVKYNNRETSLTATEGLILQLLAENAGQVVSYSTLAERIWGEKYPGAVESLRVYILRLRKKLEKDPGHPTLIISHPGMGYSIAK